MGDTPMGTDGQLIQGGVIEHSFNVTLSRYYSAVKLRRDVPEFHPVVSLATGMRQVFAAMEREGRIPPAEGEAWEDHLIAWQTQQAQRTE